MKLVAGTIAVLASAAAAFTVWIWEPWAETEEESPDPTELSDEFRGSACRQFAGLAARIAAADPSPLIFLRELGRQAAGIRPPPRALGDLARGGRNKLPGKGFVARFDDGTTGQARHFAGIAVATTFGGIASTRLISIFVRDDPAESADGRLTDEAISFASQVLRGELELEEAPRWLLDHLCRRRP